MSEPTGYESFDNSKICAEESCNHLFALKPHAPICSYHQSTSLHFCPKYSNEKGYFQNIYPQYNFNNKPFIDSFALEIDLARISKQLNQYQEAHNNKIRALMIPKKEIMIPHPGKNKEICHVCKKKFADYRKHIALKSHKKQINSSKAEVYIAEMMETFKKEREEEISKQLDLEDLKLNHVGRSETMDTIKFFSTQPKSSVNRQKLKQSQFCYAFDDSDEQEVQRQDVQKVFQLNKGLSERKEVKAQFLDASDFLLNAVEIPGKSFSFSE